MDLKIVDNQGKELSKLVTLDESVFANELNKHTIYLAIKQELHNKRQGNAKTKERGEINASTAKPWRQKGTGRARAGSRKSPIWRGGGTVFGPRLQDYNVHMPRKMKRNSLKFLIGLHAQQKSLKVVDKLDYSKGKTKDIHQQLVSITDKKKKEYKRVLVILNNDEVLLKQSLKNIPWVKYLPINQLNAHDLFYAHSVVIAQDNFEKLTEFYKGKA